MNSKVITNPEMDQVEKLIALEKSCKYQCYRKILKKM